MLAIQSGATVMLDAMHVFIAMAHALKIAHHLAPSEPSDIEFGHGQLLKGLDGQCQISEGDTIA